jgi:hypothetical protein
MESSAEAQLLAAQFTDLSLELANVLQNLWTFTAFVTLGAIGWGVSTRRSNDPPGLLARLLVALGLSIFYALNSYVLWSVMERFHAAERVAKAYTEEIAGGPNIEFDLVYKTLDSSLLLGTVGIQVCVVLIVFMLMSPAGRGRREPGASARAS